MSIQDIAAKVKALETEIAKAEGSKERIMSELKANYSVNSIEEAEALIQKMGEDIVTLSEVIENDTKALNELTNWNLV